MFHFFNNKELLNRMDELEKRVAKLEAQNKKLKKAQKEASKKAENQTAQINQALAKGEKQRKKKEKAAKDKERYLKEVVAETGWDPEYASEQMERSREVAGASYAHYVFYKFWDISEEEQKTYFTKREAVALRRKYNTDRDAIKVFMNKDLCCAKLEAFMGRPWMSTNSMTLEEFEQKFAGEEKIVFKPRAGTQGHGIKVLETKNRTMEDLFNEISTMPEGVLEGYLVQHPEMKKLSINSVNTIRIVTIFTNQEIEGVEKDKVHFIYAGVRMGQGSSFVDNLHSGGLMAGVDIETGEVITAGVDHKVRAFDVHPDTGVPIKGFKIPFFAEAKQMLELAGNGIPGCLGWDVAITPNGPVIVEVNTSPGADGLQTPYVPQRKGMRHVIEKYL